MTRRAAGECGERCVFGLAQLAEPHYAGRRATLIALPQPLAQPDQGLAAKQPLKAGIDCHCGGKRRSGSSSLSPRPSQVQRDTCTASMPSRRCSWQIAAGQFGITGPFTLAGDHEIEVELADQAHAVRAGGIVDAGEGFVEQHQAGAKA
jgi:hypothetical protein